MPGLSVTTDATALPVSLTEFKSFARIDASDEDALATLYLRAATRRAQLYQNRQYVTATLAYTLDDFANLMILPRAPLASVSSITYVDTGGATQTLSTDVYKVTTDIEPGRVTLKDGQTWPSVKDEAGVVTITYVAGWATPATADAGADTLTLSGRTYSNGDKVRLWNTGGALPGGLSADTDYHVVGASGSSIQLSATSGGSAIDLTSAGTGTTFVGEIPEDVRVAIMAIALDLFEHRPSNLDGRATSINEAARDMLWTHRIMEVV